MQKHICRSFLFSKSHCVKSVRIRSFSGPNTVTFYAVKLWAGNLIKKSLQHMTPFKFFEDHIYEHMSTIGFRLLGIYFKKQFQTTKKKKFSIKDIFSKLRTWSHLLKKSLMENFLCNVIFLP